MFRKKIFSFSVISLSVILLFNACNTNEPEKIESVRFDVVNGFIISPQGEKLLATDIGLVSFNEENKTFFLVESELKLAPLNDLAYSKEGSFKQLLLASNSGVLNFTVQSLITSSNSGLQNNNVTRLSFDNNDRIFFATPYGISILDDLKWSESQGLNNLYLNYAITDIESAANGFTYVTTNGGGVERFKTNVDGISGATIFDTDWTKLESNNINTVYIDSITQVYGTDAGVAMHFSEFTKWDWETFTTNNGLIDNNVISVVKDKSNNWWFGTTAGLSQFKNSTWINYTVETNNIISNEIKFLAVDIDGTVWIASDEGLSHFINNQWINYSK
jgi:ligand-binding sensor domain-containing protein